VLVIGGVNVYPQDVEAVVSDILGVHAGRVAAFATFDRALQTDRITVLAESNVAANRGAALVIHIRQALVSALQISAIEVHLVPRGWLVKSTAGKIARRATREKWEMAACVGGEAPLEPMA
jgi:fatty-acyl-CoA synthase